MFSYHPLSYNIMLRDYSVFSLLPARFSTYILFVYNSYTCTNFPDVQVSVSPVYSSVVASLSWEGGGQRTFCLAKEETQFQ